MSEARDMLLLHMSKVYILHMITSSILLTDDIFKHYNILVLQIITKYTTVHIGKNLKLMTS